jgi:hypothetical protein
MLNVLLCYLESRCPRGVIIPATLADWRIPGRLI